MKKLLARCIPSLRTRRAIAVGLFCAWVIGQIFRDATWITGMCFYIPSPFLAVLFGLALIVNLLKRRRAVAAVAGALLVAPLCFTLLVENQWEDRSSASTEGERLRLVHWNVSRGWFGWERICRALQHEDADAYVLSEVPSHELQEKFAESLPGDFHIHWCGNMALVVEGKIRRNGWLFDEGGVRIYSIDWNRDGRWLKFIVADLPAQVTIARDPLLSKLRSYVEELQPDFVIGDFNAPRRSRVLAALPDGYRHAYDAVGSGWGYTWPVPFPMYAIDQCVFGPRIEPLDYWLDTKPLSDHRLQVFEFAVRNGQ